MRGGDIPAVKESPKQRMVGGIIGTGARNEELPVMVPGEEYAEVTMVHNLDVCFMQSRKRRTIRKAF